ncbi:MAG: oxidoreductase domain protein [Gemmatimonadales bacterium]|jgi:predicted dehydrogenase|nr:oxidoreductase domain protein [Gemmatimonadales bacterium]
MINIGVIGYGYWGPNLVRNFAEVPGCRVHSVCDSRAERLNLIASRYPGVKITTDADELINDPEVDAVVIATPVSSHFELAYKALSAGKHALVEKPLTSTSEQAARLIELAELRGLTLMVDHTFVYTGAVQNVRHLVRSGAIGDVYYFDSERINLGLFQHDVNVIWDLAVHDLSIMDYVLPVKPSAVSVTGMNHVYGAHENIAFLTLFFPGQTIAHIHVNWLAPVKLRRTLIGGSKRMIVYDDMDRSEPVKVYDKGIATQGSTENVHRMLVDYRIGDMWAPHIDPTEALKIEAKHFITCIETGERPTTDGEMGLRVVRILEAASRSMAARGELVELASSEAFV